MRVVIRVYVLESFAGGLKEDWLPTFGNQSTRLKPGSKQERDDWLQPYVIRSRGR